MSRNDRFFVHDGKAISLDRITIKTTEASLTHCYNSVRYVSEMLV